MLRVGDPFDHYTSDVACESPTVELEPWEPNVTADPRAERWREFLTPGTPFPTPWPKEAFESLQRDIQGRRRESRAQDCPEGEMEDLFRLERERTTSLPAQGPHAQSVGAFEGAMHEAKGYYRPQSDCIIFTRDEVGFCAVCRRAIERNTGLYATRG